MKNFRESLNEKLKDPEFRKEYEFLEKNAEVLSLIRVSILDKIMVHPLMSAINKFADYNTYLAREMRDTFIDEMLTDIYFKHEKEMDNVDIKKWIEENNSFLDEAYTDLTKKSDDDIVITYDDVKKLDENFPELLFKQILLIVQYINAYGISKIIRADNNGESVPIRTMIFIFAYLDTILKYAFGPTEEDKDKQRVHIRDVIHNRQAIKNLARDMKERSKIS